LLTNGMTTFQGYLLDGESTLGETTDTINVLDYSLVDLILGDIDIPDFLEAVLQLDAGVSLDGSIATEAVLSADSITLGDGTTFTSEGDVFPVAALPPSYDTTADYNENLIWDLTLNFVPSLYIQVLGQSFSLPVLNIPWTVFDGQEDLEFNQETISVPVPEVAEGEGEGLPEGGFEGEGDGGFEGEGGIDFIGGCPEPCAAFCDSEGVLGGLETALSEVLAGPAYGADPSTADLDGDGVRDIDLAKLLDVVLANPPLPTHCCVLARYEQNLAALQASSIPDVDGVLTSVTITRALTAMITFGTPEWYALFRQGVEYYGRSVSDQTLTTAAAPYIASFGDVDLDGTCNAGEYNAESQDPLAFIFSATDSSVSTDGGGCPEACTPYLGGGEGEGASGGEPEGEGESGPPYTLTVIQEGTGIGDFGVFPDRPNYTEDFIVTLTIVAQDGSAFGGWNGAAGVTQPGEHGDEVVQVNEFTFTIRMDSDKVIRPYFFLLEPSEGEGAPAEGEGEGLIVIDGEGGLLEGEGGGETPDLSSVDVNGDLVIQLAELLRLIQLFNASEYYCGQQTEDGYAVGAGEGEGETRACDFHTSDYNPPNWTIELTELLRLVQFFNLGGYVPCGVSEDGFCVGGVPI